MRKSVLTIITILFGTSIFSMNISASEKLDKNSVYQISLEEKPMVRKDLESLQDTLGENKSRTGFIVFSKKDDRYVMVYSQKLAQKIKGHQELFNSLYKVNQRGFEHGQYDYKDGRLSISGDDDYHFLYNTQIGKNYSTDNGVNLELNSMVTKLN